MSVKVDPKDKQPVAQKFRAHDLVAVDQLDGQVKIIKNRFGSSCAFIPGWNWDSFIKELRTQNTSTFELKVWRLDYHEANELLKGLVAL